MSGAPSQNDGDALTARIDAQLGQPVNPAIAAYANRLAAGNGDAEAVLFYGSNLRTGSLDGVLDFYVLLSGPQRDKIWPRVSYHEWEHEGEVLRAKVAMMALATFGSAAAGETRDTTIWARFVQPSALVWVSGEDAQDKVRNAIAAAVRTAARLAVALGPPSGLETAYWRALFQATYKAELRVEKPGRENTILEANAAHFDGLLPAALGADNIPFSIAPDDVDAPNGKTLIVPKMQQDEKARIKRWWHARRRLGKPLNTARLIKATTTFEGASRYAAWKIERHTGVKVEVTPWREKHPVLSAPKVLWKIWRARR